MSFTLDNTVKLFSQHHLTYADEIAQSLKNGIEWERDLQLRIAEHTYSTPNATVNSIIQPYQCQFTPNNTHTMSADEWTLDKMKIDISFDCDELEKFWNTYYATKLEYGKARKDWSFPMYMYEKVIMPQIMEDLDWLEFNGVQAAPTPGTAGALVGSMDGLHKHIKGAIAGSVLSPIATGAITANDAVDKIETFVDGLPESYRMRGGVIYAAPKIVNWYGRKYRADFGAGAGNGATTSLTHKIDGFNITLVPRTSMAGKQLLIFDPSFGNLIIGNKKGVPLMPVIRWQEQDRNLKGLAEITRFIGWEFNGHLFVNDQDNV